MTQQSTTDSGTFQDLLTSGESAYRDYRAGQSSLQTVYQKLVDCLYELEQRRLEHPRDVPQLRFLERYDLYETIAGLAYSLGRVREAFDHAERARARALLDRTLNKVSTDSKRLTDHTLLQRESELSRQVRELTRRWHADMVGNGETRDMVLGTAEVDRPTATPAVDMIEAELRRTRAELLDVQNAIKEQDPAFAALRGVTPASLEDLQALLDRHTAVLSYCVTEERLIVFATTQKGFWGEHVNIARSELTALVRRYRERVERFADQPRDMVLERKKPLPPAGAGPPADPELDSLAHRLYDILVRPAEIHLRGKTCLGVIPHGDLHLLPFQALRNDQGYLLERFALWYAPSISLMDLCHQRQRRSQSRLLALGNPELGNPQLRLPFAEQEVLAIAPLFDSQPYTGRHANRMLLRQHWGQCDLLHLACHAVWDAQQPEFSALLLTPGKEDHGRLEVQELFGLDKDLTLSQVTLSACNTSLGAGSDLTGLATGFLYAGSPAVVASLWRVDDFSTSELMLEFYRNLREADRADALRTAQLKLLRSPEHSHPYFWAAFKLIGSPARIDSEREQASSAFNLIHRWTYRSEDGYLIGPVVDQGTLYTLWRERNYADRRQAKRAIYAISLADRHVRWRWEDEVCVEYHCWCPGLLHVDGVHKVSALRVSDGTLAWEHRTGSPFTQSLRCQGSVLYFGGQSKSVFALRAETGEVVWEYQLPRRGSGGFGIGAGRVFVGCQNRHVYSIDAGNGRLAWERDLGWDALWDNPGLVRDGFLHTNVGAFNVVTGERRRDTRWEDEAEKALHQRIERANHLPPARETTYHAVDADLVFTSSIDDNRVGFLTLFNARTGRLLRRYRLAEGKVTGICREGDLVIVGAGDGTLHSFSVERLQKTGEAT